MPRTGEVMSITTDEALKALQRTSDDLAVAPEDSATRKPYSFGIALMIC